MKQFADSLRLSPRWWWGSVAAIVVVALIFFAAGSAIAAIVCLLAAAGVAALAHGADGPREDDAPKRASTSVDEPATQASSDRQ